MTSPRSGCCAASWAQSGSRSTCVCISWPYVAPPRWKYSEAVRARLDGSTVPTTGPPPGPGFRWMSPCTSRSRSASRSDARLTPYCWAIAASSGNRSPVRRPCGDDVADDVVGDPLGRLHRSATVIPTEVADGDLGADVRRGRSPGVSELSVVRDHRRLHELNLRMIMNSARWHRDPDHHEELLTDGTAWCFVHEGECDPDRRGSVHVAGRGAAADRRPVHVVWHDDLPAAAVVPEVRGIRHGGAAARSQWHALVLHGAALPAEGAVQRSRPVRAVRRRLRRAPRRGHRRGAADDGRSRRARDRRRDGARRRPLPS